MSDWKQQAQDAGVEASDTMGRLVNSYSSEGGEAFIKRMSCEHRTLQQSFTRLCLKWLEHVASEEYRTDGRNEDSKKVAKRLIDGFIKEVAKEGHASEEEIRKNLDVYLPSKWLGNI